MESEKDIGFRVVRIFLFFFLTFVLPSTFSGAFTSGHAQDVKELALTPRQLKQYASTYKMPEVRRLRKFLNTYGDSRDKVDPGEEEAAKGLDARNIDKNILKGKFVVYWVGGFLGGGKSITIVSQEHPEVMLEFWVYKLGNRACQVRALIDEPEIADLESFKKRYFKFLHDKHLAM